jgi:uncharacterized protein
MLLHTMTNHNRTWLHEPAQWSETGDTLTLTASPDTDYWQVTHYGFVHDNGALRYQEQAGNFEAKVRVTAKYHELYHQAGLMIRLDDKNWIKAGIEFLNGQQHVSAVVTRNFSDWSVLPYAENPAFIWLRMQRFHDTVQVSYSRDNEKWSMIRLAYFPQQVTVKIGMMAAAPGKLPLNVTFDDFSLRPLLTLPLED